MKKMYAFNAKKNTAGSVAQKGSLTFILIATPKNINMASPAAETSKIIGYFNPTSKPSEPNNSKTAISAPAFSSPNLLNSAFIFIVLKYAIP